MQRYLITELEFDTNTFSQSHSHQIINVMRLKVNSNLILLYNNEVYLASIKEITIKKEVIFSIIEKINENNEFDFSISLFQGYPKSDKLDYITQKAVELGITNIYPIIMERSIVVIDPKKSDSKKERLQKIADEAMEQSRRTIRPIIKDIKKLKETSFDEFNIKILAYENSNNLVLKDIISKINKNDRIAIVVGPEGGISKTEEEFLKGKGFISVSLGSRILRTETSSLFLLSSIGYEKGVK